MADSGSDVARAAASFLWGLQGDDGSGGDGRRARLTPARIAQAAIDIADAEGLDAVSMQRVGKELGYAAMALYRYVPGKALLVAAMSDRAFGTPPVRPIESGAGAWRAEVHQWADALWELFQRHPWMLWVSSRTAPTGPHELAWFESLLGSLAKSGLAHGEMVAAATFIFSAVRDLARIASELVPAAFSYGDVLRSILGGGAYPMLASVIASGTFDEPGGGENDGLKAVVVVNLDLFMDGIDSRTPPSQVQLDKKTRGSTK
jgi:AcrR family transcriptional regulator